MPAPAPAMTPVVVPGPRWVSTCLAWVVLATALLATTAAHAQANSPSAAPEPPYRLHGGNGLPHNNVYDLHFDAEGWLWLATSAGLYRYDGVDYVHYGSALARHREIHNIETAPDGAIYCQNFRKQIFRVSGDSLALAVDLGAERREFATFAALPTGLAIVVESELYVRDYDRLAAPRAVAIPEGAGGGGDRPGGVLPGVGSRAVIAGRSGRPYATFDGARARRLADDGLGHVRLSYAAPHGDYVLRDRDDTLRWQRVGDGELTTVWESVNPVAGIRWRACLEQADGSLLFGGDGGLWVFTTAGTWERRIAQTDVANLRADANGRIWTATLDRGVLALPRRTLPRREYPTLPSTLSAIGVLPGGRTFGVTRVGHAFHLGDTASLLDEGRYDALIWRSGPDTLRIDTRLGVEPGLRVNSYDPGPIARHNILKAAVGIRPGAVAYAGISGCFVQTDAAEAEVFASEKQIGARLVCLRTGRCYDVDYDASAHRLWASFADSLLAFGRHSRRAIRSPLLATAPTTVDVLAPGEVVVGTSGDGLIYGAYDPAGDTVAFAHVPSVTGTQVEAVAVAGSRAWVVTEAGLFRCVRGADAEGGAALACEPIGPEFGLPPQVPSAIAATETHAYVAYETMLYELEATLLAPAAQRLSRAFFAHVEVAGKAVPVAAAADGRGGGAPAVTLAAQRDALAVQLRAPVYGTGEPPAFRYRVRTLDTAWRTIAGQAPELFFGSLPRGRHVVELAVDSDGAPVSTLVVDARLAPWRRPLTLALVAIGLAAAVAFAVFARSRRRAREAETAAELRRATLTAIASQMNPHFIFNALNAIQEFVIDEDPVKANTYLSRFAKLMRLTLEHSRAELVPLRDEVEAMRLYSGLEELRHDGHVRVTFEVDRELPMQALLPPLLVQPHIENAFKHGVGPGVGEHITVSYRLSGPMTLLVEVRDDGVGRAAARARHKARIGRAFGAGASEQRVALLSATDPGGVEIEVRDLFHAPGIPAGTLIRVRVRLRQPAPASATAVAVPT